MRYVIRIVNFFYVFVCLCYIISPITAAADLKIHFIDVGQGDSILLQSGSQNMLVDAGPGSSGNTVVNYLKSQGVSSLDVVVATHPHEDHIGGMIDILNNFQVDLYVDNGVTHTTSTYEQLINRLVDEQIPYAEVKAGKTIPFVEGITISVLSPSSISGDMNKDSIILKIIDGTQKVLLSGDSSLTPGDVQAQILKVPHHGSKTSSSLSYFKKVKPDVAVICAGSNNDFGHPSSDAILNLQRIGADIYRTDLDGTIVISTDGASWSIDSSSKSGSKSTNIQPSPKSFPRPTVTPYSSITSYNVVPFVSAVSPISQSVSSSSCNCNGPDLNCKDFSSQSSAQSCYDYCKSKGYGDCFTLDRDGDGRVCESL